MAIAFSPLLPGETIPSNLSRYMEALGIKSYASLGAKLFGDKLGISSLLPARLERICHEARDYWNISPDACVESHTAFYYMTVFVLDSVRQQIRRQMRSGPMLELKGVPKYVARKRTLPLRYCRECLEACRLKGWEPYYHIDHQLPGVFACPIHGSTLLAVAFQNADFPPSLRQAMSARDEPPITMASQLHAAAANDVACRSAYAREGHQDCFLSFPYMDMFRAAGLILPSGKANHQGLLDAFLEYFGAPFCYETGIDATTISARFWANKTMSRRPARFLALQSLLAYRASVSSAIVPPTPGTDLESTENLEALRRGNADRPRAGEIKDVTLRQKLSHALACDGCLHRRRDFYTSVRVTKRTRRACLDCSCGMSFSFHVDADNVPSEIRRARRTSVGSRYRLEFERLVRSGQTPSAAGRALGIVERTALAWKMDMPEWKAENAAPRSEILRARETWVQVTSSEPLTRAFLAHRKLHRFLSLHDKAWLKSFNRNLTEAGYADEVLRVVRAVTTIYEMRIPTRVDAAAVCRVSGLSLHKVRRVLAREPEVRGRLESQVAFQDRVLGFWTARLESERPLTLTNFLERCHLGRRLLSPAQRARVDRWLQGEGVGQDCLTVS